MDCIIVTYNNFWIITAIFNLIFGHLDRLRLIAKVKINSNQNRKYQWIASLLCQIFKINQTKSTMCFQYPFPSYIIGNNDGEFICINLQFKNHNFGD